MGSGVAIIAALFGFAGIATAAAGIAKVCVLHLPGDLRAHPHPGLDEARRRRNLEGKQHFEFAD